MVSTTASLANAVLAGSGLCRSCTHAQGCAHRLRHDDLVLQCEDFDDRPAPGQASPPPAPEPSPEVATPTASAGLCVNCLHREHCGLPGAVHGVWHCEEYA